MPRKLPLTLSARLTFNFGKELNKPCETHSLRCWPLYACRPVVGAADIIGGGTVATTDAIVAATVAAIRVAGIAARIAELAVLVDAPPATAAAIRAVAAV